MSILTPRQDRPTPLHPGLVLSQKPDYGSRTVYGAAPTSQISRITLSSSTATAVSVTVTLGGDSRTVTLTFAGSVDATNSAALLAALRADELFAGFFATIAAGTSTANDLTGLGAQTPTVTVSGVGISVATTQAAAASPSLLFGRTYPIGARTASGELVSTAAATRSALAGPVITFTGTWSDAADNYSLSGTLIGPDGAVKLISETGSTGADLAAFLAALNTDLTGEVTGATVTTSSPTVVWALPVGWSVANLTSSADSDSDLTYVLTAGSTAPANVGVMKNPMNREFTDFSGTYPTGIVADQGAVLVTKGAHVSVPLPSGVTVSDGDPVWIETTAGANYGLAYPTPSPSRYTKGWTFVAPSSGDIAVVGV